MEEWQPISRDELLEKIQSVERDLDGEFWNFWQLIKITPTKWDEKEYGEEGGGFWAVGICGTKVMWYNDIEEGFSISDYTTWGEIHEYYCNQDELNWAVVKLFNLVKLGGEITGRSGPPEPL